MTLDLSEINRDPDTTTPVTLTGALPLSYKGLEQTGLIDYKFYGTSDGVGTATENLWDGQSTSLTFKQVADSGSMRWTFTITEPGFYTLKCFENRRGYVYCRRYNTSTDTYGTLYRLSVPEGASESPQIPTLEVDSDLILIIYARDAGTADETAVLFNQTKLCPVSGTTAPTSYSLYGYVIPIINSQNLIQDEYDIYIGDSKLIADEYVDYSEQKIYKYVDNVLTPIDPPASFPGILAYEGEKQKKFKVIYKEA